MTGLDLKLKRVAADVSATDLARAMGVSPSRVSHIEAQRKPHRKATVDRYVQALGTCDTNSTSEVA